MTDEKKQKKAKETEVTFSIPREHVLEWLRDDVNGYVNMASGEIVDMVKDKETFRFVVVVGAP